MVAALDDTAVIQHHDDVRVHDGGQTVGDDEHSAALHELIHTRLHDGLGTGIDDKKYFYKNEEIDWETIG